MNTFIAFGRFDNLHVLNTLIMHKIPVNGTQTLITLNFYKGLYETRNCSDTVFALTREYYSSPDAIVNTPSRFPTL